MIRNLKALGLAFVAMLALGVAMASTASAAEFTAANGLKQHLIATDPVPTTEEDKFETATGSVLTCDGETFTAEAPAGQTTDLTFTPNWVNCKTSGAAFNNVTVTHNGCNLTFTVSPNEAHIVCSPGKVIEVHHYSSTANHSSGTSSCTETIEGQTPTIVKPIEYTNVKGGVKVHGVVKVNVKIDPSPCTLGFTINTTAEYFFSNFVSATSGDEIHVK